MSKKSQFSTKIAKETIKSNTRRPRLQPGIHQNCLLEKVDLGETQTGKNYMDFSFAQKETDLTARKRVWYPSDTPYQREGESEPVARQREINEALGHIVTIMECYMTSDEAELEASSFDEFCQRAKAKLEQQEFDAQSLNLKLIFDVDGKYSEFPRFPNYIERQSNNAPQIRFSKWEMNNRMTASQESLPDSDTAVTRNDIPDEDLPF